MFLLLFINHSLSSISPRTLEHEHLWFQESYDNPREFHTPRNKICDMKTSVVAIATLFLSSFGAVVADEYWDLTGTTVAKRGDLAGTILVDQLRPFQGFDNTGATFKGVLQDRVVRRSISGTLDFYYRIEMDAASTAPVSRVIRAKFDQVPMASRDVNWRLDGLGTKGPTTAHRSAACCIETIFGSGGLKPGTSSRFVFIGTGATQYDSKGVYNIYPVSGDKSLFIGPGFAPTA
ncbi:hypothetical protein V8F06_013828 [Rhypophila decipiens]